jgi:hypothetical protein
MLKSNVPSLQLARFIRELSLIEKFREEVSVKQLISSLHSSGESIQQMDFHNILRRAWIDTNKQTSYVFSLCSGGSLYKNLANANSLESYSQVFREESDLASEIGAAVRGLQTNGFYKFKTRLHTDRVRDLKKGISKYNLHPEVRGQKISSVVIPRDICLKKGSHLRYFYPAIALSSMPFMSIASSMVFKIIAKTYLNSNQLYQKVTGWLSVGRSGTTHNDLSEAAQEYHFDYDAFNFVKVFIYLSDVTPDRGAHQYVSSSHKAFPVSGEYLKQIPTYFRATKEMLCRIYDENNFVSHYGKEGTIIIEDTSGFHRGSPLPPGKTRDILMIEYLDSDFSALTDGTS